MKYFSFIMLIACLLCMNSQAQHHQLASPPTSKKNSTPVVTLRGATYAGHNSLGDNRFKKRDVVALLGGAGFLYCGLTTKDPKKRIAALAAAVCLFIKSLDSM